MEVDLPMPSMALMGELYEEVGPRVANYSESKCPLTTLGQSADAIGRRERSAAHDTSLPYAGASITLAAARCTATVQDTSGQVIAGQPTARKSSTKKIAGIGFKNALPLIQPEALPWLKKYVLVNLRAVSQPHLPTAHVIVTL